MTAALEIRFGPGSPYLADTSLLHAVIMQARFVLASTWPDEAIIPTRDVCGVEYDAGTPVVLPELLEGMRVYARVSVSSDRSELYVPFPLGGRVRLATFPFGPVPLGAIPAALTAMAAAATTIQPVVAYSEM
jgi:hypothetical protein